MNRYASFSTTDIQQARAKLLAGLTNHRLTATTRIRMEGWVADADAELRSLSRASKVALVQTGWQSTPLSASGIDRIMNPATGEVIGWVMESRGWIVAFDAKDRMLDRYQGVDARTRAADRIWRTVEARTAAVA